MENVSKLAYFRNLRKENSSKITAEWFYRSIKFALDQSNCTKLDEFKIFFTNIISDSFYSSKELHIN